jgi:DNA-binding NarL/FixJ family response regulator
MLRGMRVLIADDHRLMVEGTKQALQRAGGFEVVGEAVTGVQVLPLVRRLKPDLVLLDLRMPQMDGLTCLAKIRKEFPDVKVAILSVSQDPDLIQTALKRGANAYIVKTIDPDDLAGALRQALDGNVFTTAGLTEDPGQRAARDAGLTERELGIVRAVARGLSNEAISKELWVAEQTVKFHLTNIYRKLGVSNRTEAARYAFEHGLAEPEGGSAPDH